MIVSASRRTDIPSYHAEWFMERFRAGFCIARNPFDPRRETRISLRPEDLECIVFWTRNPSPLMPFLGELEAAGTRFYFQFTLTGYPRTMEPSANRGEAIRAFLLLSEKIGPERMIWRYDPVVLGSESETDFHLRNFSLLLKEIGKATKRLVVSIYDDYARSAKRFAEAKVSVYRYVEAENEYKKVLSHIAEGARSYGLEIMSCAEKIDLSQFGVAKGACIDPGLIRRLWGIEVNAKKDRGQRKECHCVASKDIGAYDTCPAGCIYCYAYSSRSLAIRNIGNRIPGSSAIVENSSLPPR